MFMIYHYNITINIFTSMTVKIVFLGDMAVGKTSIINRCIRNTFNDLHTPTVGVGYEQMYVKVNEKTIRTEIWDTAG